MNGIHARSRFISLRRTIILLAATVVSLLLTTERAGAEFYTYQTKNVQLFYYGKAQEYLVRHTVRCTENALLFHRNLYDWTPSERTLIVMHDMSDYNNAGATTLPWNGVTLGIAPPSYAFETTPANERINATMNHEVVHLVANDRTGGTDGLFRSLFFGKVRETSDHPETILYAYMTGPRRSSPRWYQEGIAVFLETWMAGGLGRALSSYDEMVFRTAVRDSAHLYDPVGLESEGTAADFQAGTNSYLYGTRFMSYLALQYSPEEVVEWTKRSNGSRHYFGAQFKNVFGMSLDDGWRDWIEWERQFQRENLDAIRSYPTTDFRTISGKAAGSVSRGVYDAKRNRLYCGVNYPGEVAYIAAFDLDTGDIEKLCDIKGPALYFVTSIAFDSTSDRLFYSTDNNSWRDLRSYDLNTGETRTLLKDARVGDLSINYADSSLWGVRHFNGITTLVRMPYPYDEWNQIWSLPYGRDVYGIAVSPDGRYISAGLSAVNGDQTLVIFDVESVMTGDTTFTEIFDFGNSLPSNFTWSTDGDYLIGTSYYTGVSNVFRFNFWRWEMEGGSNAESGFFNPVPVSDDTTLVFRYTGDGFVPVLIANREVTDISAIKFLGQQIVEKHPVVKDWLAGAPGDIDLDTLVEYQGEYYSLTNIRLANAYPVVEGYGDYVAWGMRFNLQDPININRIDLTATYSPQSLVRDDERLHVEANYARGNYTLTFKHNDADFYDLFGPTKTSRRGTSLGINYRRRLLQDGHKAASYHLSLTGYTDLERLPEFQNIVTSYSQFLDFNIGIGFSNRRSSLGAVDFEKGILLRAGSSNRYVNRQLFSRFYGVLDVGAPFLFPHSSIWLRNAAGFSPDDRMEPLANFYFGGFGNNWVDHGSVKQYRQYTSFPGLELNELGGVNFVKSMLEWSLPPLRFRKIGTSSFYMTWLRPALFATGISTNVDSDLYRASLGNLGGQLDFRFMLLSHLRMTFSVGYAMAFEDGYKPADEFMMSLRVL